jgi:hypothetical protein
MNLNDIDSWLKLVKGLENMIEGVSSEQMANNALSLLHAISPYSPNWKDHFNAWHNHLNYVQGETLIKL